MGIKCGYQIGDPLAGIRIPRKFKTLSVSRKTDLNAGEDIGFSRGGGLFLPSKAVKFFKKKGFGSAGGRIPGEGGGASALPAS